MTATTRPRASAAASTSTVFVLGIRHHGPGSARSVLKALETLEPDIVLVEGPPDGDSVIPWLAHAEMTPPVALLIYRPEQPKHAAYYPFAEFSPEFQALRYALRQGIPARFMDLPMAHQLGQEPPELPTAAPDEDKDDQATPEDEPSTTDTEAPPEVSARRLRIDPLQVLAEAAGFEDGERWWEHVVEHRRDGADLFAAILEAMAAVRDDAPPIEDERELRREAFMRTTIRAAQAEDKQRIAVICGAWHAPALTPDRWPPVRDDDARLRGLPKVKVAATWVPWTNDRLAFASGYGAGVQSPGWYSHLWSAPDEVVGRWMTRIARLLRDEGLDASSASVIESVRLAEALAAIRDRPLPGLAELDEAARTVFCFGDDMPMRLVRRKLTVGEVMGQVPNETPMVPLQADLIRLQKQLRLPPESAQTTKVLDLRDATDLARSQFLHRLALLGIAWGHPTYASGKGTFKEGWQLQWQPEFAVAIIEASTWGTTVLDAATAKASDIAGRETDLPTLARLLDNALLADLPEAAARIMAQVEARSAVAGDVLQLMAALLPLANLLRYGNVRKTDATMVAHAAKGMIARICIGLPLACGSLDDAAAESMFEAIGQADAAIHLVDDPEHLGSWQGTLRQLADSDRVHQLVVGRCCRILLDAQIAKSDEVARRMNLAVSTASDPAKAAAWIEGFLKGSGEILVHDEALFAIINDWLAALHPDAFTQLLPLLRRTFGSFEAPVRRNLGEKAKRGASATPTTASRPGSTADFDAERAATVLPLLAQLLGPKPS